MIFGRNNRQQLAKQPLHARSVGRTAPLTADRRGPGIGDLGPLLLRRPTSPDRGPAQNRGWNPADRHSNGQVDLYREPRTAPHRVSIDRFTHTDLLRTGDTANDRARSTSTLLCGRNIQKLLEQRWSPAQISWHLDTEHPDQPARVVRAGQAGVRHVAAAAIPGLADRLSVLKFFAPGTTHRKKCRFERPLAERRKTGTGPVKPLDTLFGAGGFVISTRASVTPCASELARSHRGERYRPFLRQWKPPDPTTCDHLKASSNTLLLQISDDRGGRLSDVQYSKRAIFLHARSSLRAWPPDHVSVRSTSISFSLSQGPNCNDDSASPPAKCNGVTSQPVIRLTRSYRATIENQIDETTKYLAGEF